jgi:hypothetical protein
MGIGQEKKFKKGKLFSLPSIECALELYNGRLGAKKKGIK